MDVRPGYKRTEVGVIPEEWHISRFGDLCSVLRGGSPRPIQNYITNDTNGINWIKIGDVGVGAKYIDATAEKIIPAGVPRSRFVKAGDFLLSNSMSFGRPYILRIEGCIHDGWLVIQAYHTKFDTEYLYYYLSAEAVLAQYARYAAGSSVLNLNKEVVSNISVAVPPLPEQQAIAAALSDVDALLGGLDHLIAKKRDLKQAAMQQLLTGQTRLPGFNGEWEVKRLGDAGKCLRGVSYRGDSDLASHDTPDTKWLLRSNNVQDATVVTNEVQFVNAARVASRQILQKDDILICMANGSKALVGKAGLFMVNDGNEYTFGAFMGCFRTNSNEANPAFVFYLFLTAQYRDYINNLLAGSSINNLKPSSIESLEFSTPPLPEQTAIAAALSDMDAELSALEARREKTLNLKQAMMQELLTGKTRLVPTGGAHA